MFSDDYVMCYLWIIRTNKYDTEGYVLLLSRTFFHFSESTAASHVSYGIHALPKNLLVLSSGYSGLFPIQIFLPTHWLDFPEEMTYFTVLLICLVSHEDG